MSGGFFRGTSADQDTRFSNKQAKLMKSQKFAPELENLVDITKVKMDVMRPWIAHRVTELLGFEDEVLINFIYGLLEGKEVNGKAIQISLTGFMEKNTGRFMKELWSLLISAQNNASGVPQQFLDAKEEETKKKMAETERIANEIQKRKEKESREQELEMMKKMDVEDELSRAKDAALDRGLKHQPGDSNKRSADDKETNGKNGSRGRSRVSRSPPSAEHSSSPPRRRPSRSISKSVSNSRSRSKSRSISRSPQPRRRRSMSSENALTSPLRRSISPRRRPSHYRRRSPSPIRRRMRSPIRRRSRSPVYRRSRSPIRRRSRPPIRYRSRTPVRRRSRSPLRPRSPSPIRRRSPSPIRGRSPSPIRRRSPSPIRRRSPSPIRRRYRRSPSRKRSVSPVRRQPTVGRRRSPPLPPRRGSHSPQESSSQSPPPRRTPPSPARRSPKRQRRSPMPSPREKIRDLERRSPVRRALLRDNIERHAETRKGQDSLVRRPPVVLRSPQRDLGERNEPRTKLPVLSPSPYKSQSVSESPPPAGRRRSPSEDRRSVSPYESPVKQTKERMIHGGSVSPPHKSRELKNRRDTPEASVEDVEVNRFRDEHLKPKSSEKRSIHSSEKRSLHSSITRVHKDSPEKVKFEDKSSPERLTSHRSGETRSRRDNIDSTKDHDTKSRKLSSKERYTDIPQPERPTIHEGTFSSEKGEAKGTVSKLGKKDERDERFGSLGSDSEDSDRHKSESTEKKKQRKSKRHEMTSDDDYSDDDSQLDARKEAKKRRKEEKRLKKEEKRRRREERRRRKEERRSDKLKLKTASTGALASDLEKGSHSSDVEETESEQKKLEIALREKALESLRAKKGASN